MKHVRSALLAATVLASLACGGDARHDAVGNRLQDVPLPGTPVPLTEIRVNGEAELTSNSGYADGTRRVIRTPEDWAAAWATTFANFGEPPPLPEVDFAKELVVLAATGTRPTGGYVIGIPNASEEAGLVRVGVVESTPGAGCVVSAEVTSPAVAVRIPRPGAEVAFVDVTSVRSCKP